MAANGGSHTPGFPEGKWNASCTLADTGKPQYGGPQLHQPAGAKFQRFAAVVTAPGTSGIAGSPLWFPDLDDGRVAVLPDISRARARPLARGGLSTKARSRSASRAEQTRLTSI